MPPYGSGVRIKPRPSSDTDVGALALCRNVLIFQDRSAFDVVIQVVMDYPELPVRTNIVTPLRSRPICT